MNEPAQSPAARGGFPVKNFMVWLSLAAFIGGGFYSGLISAGHALDLIQGVSASPLAQLVTSGSNSTATPPDWANRERVNILMMGIDRRPEEGVDYTRTDTMMIVSIDPYSKSASMLGIPRDLWVPIPVGNQPIYDRVNTANVYGSLRDYPGGGPALAKATVQYNLGVRIHYFVMMDFEGFERMIDTVGGVTVNLENALVDNSYPTPNYGTMRIFIPAGTQHFDGEHALWYVRSRHQDSDFGRMHRQQHLLLALRERALQLDVIPRLPQLWGEFNGAIRTDLSFTDLVNLAAIAKDIKSDNIISRTLEAPYVSAVTSLDGAALLLPNRNEMRPLINEVFFDARLEQESARIQILNGTGTPGLASQTAKQLQTLGFEKVAVGDAEGGPYPTTQIVTFGGKSYSANLVASTLKVSKDRVKVQKPIESNAVDIQIILGDDAAGFGGLRP